MYVEKDRGDCRAMPEKHRRWALFSNLMSMVISDFIFSIKIYLTGAHFTITQNFGKWRTYNHSFLEF
jgi:hypothetical protein